MIQYTGVDYKAERVPPVSGVNLFFFLLYSQESTPADPRPRRRALGLGWSDPRLRIVLDLGTANRV